MDTRTTSAFSGTYDSSRPKMSDINYSNLICMPNSMYVSQRMPNYYPYGNSYLSKKREGPENSYLLPSTIENTINEPQAKCFMCYTSAPGKMTKCAGCFRSFHLTCLSHEECNAILKNKGTKFSCMECRFKMNQIYQINQNVIMQNNSVNQFNTGERKVMEDVIRIKENNVQEEKDSNNNNNNNNNNFNNINNNDNDNENDNFYSLLFQVLQNSKMTNEERLTFILKNSHDIKVHPMIMKVLSEREKRKMGIDIKSNNNSNNNNNNNCNNKKGINLYQNGSLNETLNNSNEKNNNQNKKKIQFQFPQTTKTESNINHNTQSNISNVTNANITPHLIKFPIEDFLLFSSPDKYEISSDTYNRPEGSEINIPFTSFNKLLIIWDFLYTFKETLFDSSSYLHFEIPNDITSFYNELKEDENNEYFKQIVLSFLFLSVKSLKILEENLYDKEIYIVKTFLENPNSSSLSIFSNCICEIIRVITSCTTNNHLISKQSDDVIKEIILHSSLDLNVDKKIVLLNTFVAIAYETVIIKGKIIEEYRMSNNFSSEKSYLEGTLKDNEKRKKEILKSEKLDILGGEIEKLNKELEELGNVEESPEVKKKKNAIEIQIARYQSLLKEKDNLDERIKEIHDTLRKMREKLISLKVPRKRFLGFDYREREYYYFTLMPGKFYVKNKREKKWNVISKREDIDEIVNKLVEKGIKEKKLKMYIKRVLHELEMKTQEEKEKNDDKSEKTEAMTHMTSNQNDKDDINNDIEMEVNYDKEIIKKQSKDAIDLPSPIEELKNYTINEILLKMEMKFSEYLEQFSKQWESYENREKWKNIIKSTNIQSNFISSLQMFNHRFKNPYKSDIEEEESEREGNKIVILEDKKKYEFIDEDGKLFVIYETDPNKVLSPKVKIWPKDVELNEIDKYYTTIILNNITNREKLYFALHFYEDMIFGLIKRRETKKFSHNNNNNINSNIIINSGNSH